ncbi:hypothetical protein BVG16_22505 [Paenibacillus selenitireducens]|uniref:Lipoprotein n=1 Tax=Paenibacillus selenitireducens TaxID=1324314 RepID=A0A1T2X698_9BACL|nr:hypothetical protein [Paenibacillus selenitireducens]OPA75362.1 hypothetical protein BVG16_22505 [Paenibacillus selenitireducens]
MGRKLFFIFIVILCLITIVSCSNNKEVTSEDIANIRLELKEQKEELNGILYTLRLQNKSRQIIVQNNVYLSFPIKVVNETRGNDFKIEAKNNKLNIKPGEELLLTVFTPKEMYKGNNNIDITEPDIVRDI